MGTELSLAVGFHNLTREENFAVVDLVISRSI